MLLQVKNKYLKEQRINPQRVAAAMSSRDVETLKRLSAVAQPSNATELLGASILSAAQTGNVQAQADDDDDDALDGEDVNPGLRAFFY
jgi:hypothetical protein